ncbi:hypothetical protein D9758_011479 [Tetrapyrgos nigripes]|uniref:FAD-binding PCMH-type domain-containing protein n=1 Tax=Tetrapyrgos nigripes TaxID=182062 RepID=A0A8H5FRT0_9AGAR|nr:hypothetical protein D9758_011479 [Tetrapyrgos nigripes]
MNKYVWNTHPSGLACHQALPPSLSMLFLAAATVTNLILTPSALAGIPRASTPLYSRSYLDVCQQIESTVSNASDVYFPGQVHYAQGIKHYMVTNTQLSACVVEPGTAEDVGKILTIIGSTRTPFAVKGGGHGSNPGSSSTEGVQITMTRFSEVTYDADAQTATIGTGLVWDDVYETLVPQGVNVVGGRVTGVGVAGFTLGGGYSWLTNQHGLTVDNVVSFELVKPDGSVVTVTDSSDADLFWALKGGMNNYVGHRHEIYSQDVPSRSSLGGLLTYTAGKLDDVAAATAKFAAEVTDPKAALITTANFVLGQPGVSQLLFYDGPNPPAGIFDDFLAIPSFTKDVDTRDFVSLVQAPPSDIQANQRGIFNVVPVANLSVNVINALFNESKFWGERLQLKSGSFISYDIEPFLPSILSHNTSPSSWPPTREKTYYPQNIYFSWTAELADDVFFDAARQSAAQVTRVALQDGQEGVDTAAPYPNYAIFDTPLELLYGDNLPRMREVKGRVDPDNVMSLAGGFKI